jgi:hypothetical protein
MRIFTCPHCKSSSISIGQKLFAGINPFSECPRCHSRLSISFAWRLFAALPLLAWALLNLYNLIPAGRQWLAFVVVVLLTITFGLMVRMTAVGGKKDIGLSSASASGKAAEPE